MAYLWLKAFHLIFMVAWFAGLFYIFRLFVYHVKYRDKPEMTLAYRLMEKRLLTIIMHPALFFTTVLGLLLISINPSVLRAGWFQMKLLGVLALIAYHLLAVVTHRRFERGDYFISERSCRIINEIPTLFLIVIVILAVVKPL